MANQDSATFYGIPNPDLFETAWLENTYFGRDPSFDINPRDLSNGLIIRNPHIRTIIEADKLNWYKLNSGKLMEIEADETLKYIPEGYHFIIGVIGTIGYIRDHYSSMEDFWNNSQDRRTIPRLGINIAQRMVDLLRGSSKCPIDISYQDPNGSSCQIISDSSEIAFLDSEQYKRQFKGLGRMMNSAIRNFQSYYYIPDYYDPLRPKSRIEVVNKLLEARESGFRHGVMNGIEMFIQAKEEEVIRDIWPSGDPFPPEYGRSDI